MKLATLRDGSVDGRLVVVSPDMTMAVDATGIARSMLGALHNWDEAEPALSALYRDLVARNPYRAFPLDVTACAAPLPRSPQWLDGSAFLNHARLMEKAFKTAPIPDIETIPVMYQGASDDFLGPYEDVPFVTEVDGIDFEGEFGVIVGPVAMGASPSLAHGAIRLIVQINDWSLRALGPREMATGFGFLQAKPSTSFAPFAVTPDELGEAWSNGRVELNLRVELNGDRFGEANGREMAYDFGTLVAHGARTRRLTPGSIVGSGTVSNLDRAAGSSCVSERRVIETIETGQAITPFLRFGDRVRMQAMTLDGRPGPFGAIDQRVVDVSALVH